MGIVYRALDTRLNRNVAVKALPDDFIADPGRMVRFEREAKALAALNHANILTIHDIVRQDGATFIIMEHVAGKTLGEVIPRKGMRPGEALKIAGQIAAGLAAAHAAGIVHRDLKPGNILVTESGQVKIVDFGLARVTEAGEGSSADTGKTATETGVVLGTAAYMSPEQAEGRRVDARSDIFSFGCVLYEMVSGRRAFAGDSIASTLAAVLKDPPKPLNEVLENVSPDLEKFIGRCLQKDPERRWQAMPDLLVTLRELQEESASRPLAAKERNGARSRLWLSLLVVIPLLAAGGWLAWRYRERGTPAPKLVQLTANQGYTGAPSFSPDGSQVAFYWGGENNDNFDIYVKLVGEAEASRLTTNPAPDGVPGLVSRRQTDCLFEKNQPRQRGHLFHNPAGHRGAKVPEFSDLESDRMVAGRKVAGCIAAFHRGRKRQQCTRDFPAAHGWRRTAPDDDHSCTGV